MNAFLFSLDVLKQRSTLYLYYIYMQTNPFAITHVLLSVFLPICVYMYAEAVLTDRTLAQSRTYVYIIFILLCLLFYPHITWVYSLQFAIINSIININD